jgi:hypothetical protein
MIVADWKQKMLTRKKEVEDIVQDGIQFIAQFLPKATYLYFPLLSAAAVWAIKRSKAWKEKILSWNVWADPSAVHVKSDQYILDFFKKNPALRTAFREEIKTNNLASLRRSFVSLYPIVGLEDPFLSALFYQEMEERNYPKIVAEFKERISKAVQDIEALDEKPKFLEGLESIAKELASLSSDMVTQKSIQKVLAEIIKQEMAKKNG